MEETAVKEYLSKLGKKSAEVRKNDKRFNKEYYSKLGKKSVEAKKRKKELAAGKPVNVLNRILNGEY